MELNSDTLPDIAFWKGPLLLGFVFSSILFGTCAVAFIHYLQYGHAHDRRGIRVLAWVIACIAGLSIVYSVLFAMRTFGERFGRAPDTDDAKWDCVSYALGGASYALVTGFFALRCRRMYARPLWMALVFCTIIPLVAVASIGATIAHVMAEFGTRSMLDVICNLVMASHSFHKSIPKLMNQFGGQMLSDVGITILIITKLWRSKTGWKSTDSMIAKLVIIGIETQLPPSLMAIAFLITMLTAPYGSYVLIFQCFPIVYALGFFAALNCRHGLSARMQSDRMQDTFPPSRRSLHDTIETYPKADTAAGPVDMSTAKRATNLDASTDSLYHGQEDVKSLNTSEIRLV